MSVFFYILAHNIIPIFIMISLGFLVGKKFNLNIITLSKLNFYIFVPAFIFVNLYQTKLSFNMLKVLAFSLIYLITNDIFARIISKIRKFDLSLETAFKNATMFNNTGNIGLSLITLVFSSVPFIVNGQTPYLNEALSVLITVLMFMNVTSNTIGFYNAGRATMTLKKSLQNIFTMPCIYAIPCALFVKFIHFNITETFLWPALQYLNQGMVSVALLTLGIQLSKTKIDFRNVNVHISVFTRLILGPLEAIGYIYLFGFTGITAQTVLIAYSVPTAVNTALIAVECDNSVDFATQAVVVSTVLSAVTLTATIYLARILYPV